jgi:hypothetical protein
MRVAATEHSAQVRPFAFRHALDPDLFAGHSLRAGFLTSAAKRRVDFQDDGSVPPPLG